LTELKADENSITRALRPWVQSLCSELALRLAIDFVNDYRSVERAVADRINALPWAPNVPNPERDELIEFRSTIETYGYSSYESEKWPAEDIISKLRAHVSNAPGAGDELKERNLASINNWVEEVDYLLRFSDLKTPRLWSERIL
jgi:hypothetical protein